MKLIEEPSELESICSKIIEQNKSIGLVPTMGALHRGHLSLIKRCQQENDLCIVTIFVNPTQFNNPEDLQKYPRDLQGDLEQLSELQPNYVFAPQWTDMEPLYSSARSIPLGELGKVMEGQFRPGHFDGVTQIVQILFQLTRPHRAYFGKKDFQQVAVIRKMVEYLQWPISIIPCEIERSESGLALSSRNALLTPDQLKDAAAIHQILTEAKIKVSSHTPQELEQWIAGSFSNTNLELEYVSIVDPLSLHALTDWRHGATACVVAYAGKVRLLDNQVLVD